MKAFILAAAMLAGSALAQQSPVRFQYEAHVPAVDPSGAALNAALQAELGDKAFDVRAEHKAPKFRLRLRSLPLSDLNQYVTLYEVLWLMEDTDGTELYVNSWVGYAGIDKAKSQAADIVRDIGVRIDGMRKREDAK